MYRTPLQDTDRRALFDEWRELNPDTWNFIKETAVALKVRGHRRVSTKFLVECARYLYPKETKGVPFTDHNGKVHVYRINNNDTAVMARVLLEEYPDMPIETRGA